MERGAPARLVVVAGVALLALGPGAALAAEGNVKFGGETEQARKAKLVVDSQGRAIRGVWTVMTDCSGQYEDFRAQIEIRSPLDRSTQDGFRDVGSTSDSDGTYSARYKHEVEGEYKGKRKIAGALTTTITFRRNGNKYVTCTAEDLAWKVKELKAS